MAEWSNAPVLKTDELRGSGGSNPSLSATKEKRFFASPFFASFEGFVQSVAVWQSCLREDSAGALLRNIEPLADE